MCGSSNLKNFPPNGQNDQQPNTEYQHLTFIRDDGDLCAIVAANSHPAGDKDLVKACVAELEARAEWRQHLAAPTTTRRSFLSGLFGGAVLAALPLLNNCSDRQNLDAANICPGDQLVTHPTVAQWQARLDAAIAPLAALRDGIGRPDITGEQFYALERAVFDELGDLVEAMECGPFNELIAALGIETDWLAAVGILDQYQAEKREWEAEVSHG